MSRARILVVDDNIALNRMILAILQNEGWDVSSAYDGEEALRMVHERLPNLIILDMMMPKLSGLEVCRQVTALFKVPIIMVSAKLDPDTKAQCLSAGAQEFVNKPFSPEDLVNRVKAVLHLAPSDRR
ncbi:MAG: response regulator [Dehalococcoidales bacterium]|nr:response regulator [Dehalococcoidales bacterium]